MKSATRLVLVAVSAFTLFLQCSAAPSGPSSETSGGTVQVPEEFIRFVYRAITATENASVDADRYIGNALSTATGQDKESYERMQAWIDSFLKNLVAQFPGQLLNALYSGSVTALEDCKAIIIKNVAYIIATLDEFQVIVPEGKAKEGFMVSMETILTLSGLVVEGLTEILAGSNARVV